MTPEDTFRLPSIHVKSGREALSLACRSLGLRPGETVLAPAYICDTAVRPFEEYGLRVAYHDASENIVCDVEKITADAQQVNARAILVVDYFGITPPDPRLVEWCVERGIKIIEDRCHCLMTERMEVTGAADAVVYSQRKVLPVPDGGFLLLHRRTRPESVRHELMPPHTMNFVARNLAERLVFAIGVPNPYGPMRRIRGPSGAKEELRIEKRDVQARRLPTILAQCLIDRKMLARTIERRRANYGKLIEVLRSLGYAPLLCDPPQGTIPQALPLLAPDSSLCAWLRGHGVGAYSWPGDELPATVAHDNFPVAKRLSSRLLLLPIHQDLRQCHFDRMRQVLTEWPGRSTSMLAAS